MGLSTLLDIGLTVYEAYDDGLFDGFLDRVADRYPTLYNFDSLPLFDRHLTTIGGFNPRSLLGSEFAMFQRSQYGLF